MPGLPHPAPTQPELTWSHIHGLQVAPIIVYRGPVSADTRHLTARRPYYSYWHVLRGQAELRIGEGHWTAGPGEWLLAPAGPVRRHDFTDDAEILSVSFDARWAGSLPILRLAAPLSGTGAEHPRLLARAEAVCSAVEAARERSVREAGRHSPQSVTYTLEQGLALRYQLERFVAEVLRITLAQGGAIASPDGEDARLAAVLEQLRAQLRAGPLDYPGFSRLTGLSRTQIDRLAMAQLHMSLRHHRDLLLLGEAHRLLTAEAAPVKRVALDLGFVDSAHFCRWLRQHTGHSPLSLRRHSVA